LIVVVLQYFAIVVYGCAFMYRLKGNCQNCTHIVQAVH
jgi:hypothetical protein